MSLKAVFPFLMSLVFSAQLQRWDYLDRPATIDQAIQQWQTTLKAGEINRIPELLPENVSSAFQMVIGQATLTGEAKRKLLRAMDLKFGPDNTEDFSYGYDDDEIRTNMMRITSVAVLKQDFSTHQNKLTVAIGTRDDDGKKMETQTENWMAIREEGSWKVWPAKLEEELTPPEKIQRQTNLSKKVSGIYSAICKDVMENRYANRQQVREAVFKAYSKIN